MFSAAAFRDAASPAKIELEPAYENVAAARRFVADRLIGVVADADVVADMRLAASELVTNAVEHGDPRPVELVLAVDTGVVSLSVTSHSPHDNLAPVSDWAVPSPNGITGRGLGIVRHLADDVSVSRGGGRLTIRLERHLY